VQAEGGGAGEEAHHPVHQGADQAAQIRTGDSEKFGYSLELLLVWLERGNCHKKNADRFFSMIQAASSHVKRLVGERGDWEVEVERLREQHKARSRELRDQFKQIERVFGGCSHQKVSDHFTKTQRKKIQGWRKELTDVMTAASVEEEEDMDMSEEGDVGTAREDDGADEELQPPGEDLNGKQQQQQPSSNSGGGWGKRKKPSSGQLRDEGEEWAQKAQVWKNELDSVRAEWQEDVEDKEKKIKLLQTAMQGMQQQLLEAKAAQGDLPAFLLDNKKDKEKVNKDVTLVAEWPPKAKKSNSKEPEVSTCAPPPPSANGNIETKSTEVQTESACTNALTTSAEANAPVSSSEINRDQGLPGKDARSVAILSTFLSVLSYGISTDAIASHLVNMQEGIDKDNVEQLLSRYPECFVRENKKEGQTLWRLVALKPVDH